MSSKDKGANMTCLRVDAGVCRFHTIIHACMDGEGNIILQVESGCPHVNHLEEHLPRDMDRFDALKMPFSENPIYICCGSRLPHSSCPVPSAIIKAVEVATGIGLRKSVVFTFED